MRAIDFPGRTAILGAPQGWDEAKHGPCEGLPIIRQDGACVSLWEATPEERAAIAAGANIWLHVHSGQTQPPVGLAVGPAPEPVALDARVHVPGMWRCAKCQFVLVQSNLNAVDGAVTARDHAGDRCPNCDVPLWRVTWREHAKEMAERAEELINRTQELEGALREWLAAKELSRKAAEAEKTYGPLTLQAIDRVIAAENAARIVLTDANGT